MSHKQKVTVTNDDLDIVYCTINQASYGDRDPLARFKQQRDQPILTKMSDFDMSVVRMQIPTMSLPIGIAMVELGQADVNRLVYHVSVTDFASGTTFTAPVTWITESPGASTPASPTVTQDHSNEYYFMYSYQHFVTLVNKAWETAMAGLVALVPALAGTPPPFFQFDCATQTFSFYATVAAFGIEAGPTCTAGMNEMLWTLFPNIPFKKERLGNNAYVLQPRKTPSESNVVALTLDGVGPTNYLKLTQEFPNLQCWNAPNTLVLTTQNISINFENQSPSQIFAGQTRKEGHGGNLTSPVMTDFQVEASVGYEWRQGYVFYVPSVYRMIQMIGDGPLSTLDLALSWSDGFGNVYPLTMKEGTHFNVKLMFRRRK
jgi:hypothetical protein